MVARHPGPRPDPPVLALRAEGGPGIGAGHQARSLALAQAWVVRKGAAVLVADEVPDLWADRYREAGVERVRPGGSDSVGWWVVDGYGLDAHEASAPSTRHRARIDDHAISPRDPVDLTLDQNLGARADGYGESAGTLLLGPRYALLRQDLVARIERRRARAGVAVTEGQALRLVVLAGGAPSAHTSQWVRSVIAELGDAVRTVVLDGTGDTGAALAEADLALSTAGSTCWELCALGVPSVLVAAAPNQEPLALALSAAGAAVGLGPLGEADPVGVARAVLDLAADADGRRSMAEQARRIVDGRGAARVATHLRSRLVSVRPAEADDAERIHRWNDHPDARAASFQTGPIPWNDHLGWFAARRADPSTPIYVAADHDGQDLGVVRFAVEGNVAEIGVALDPQRRGQGWGAAMIGAGCAAVFGAHDLTSVVAAVKTSNVASQRAFLDADFDLNASAGGDGVLRYARRDVGT